MQLHLYKKRFKHLLFQNQDQETQLKEDVEVTLKQVEDEHRGKERELKFDTRSLNVNLKEQEVSHNDYFYAIKYDFDNKSNLLRQDFERRALEIKKKI